ncbi:MAG: hypothetical protein KBA33_10490, partial [Cloacibacterium sp.]|nr:hypothetical protein [Cloacibacterium sp.]
SYVGEYVVAFLFKNPVSNETGFFVLDRRCSSFGLGSDQSWIKDQAQKLGIIRIMRKSWGIRQKD